MFEKLKKYKRKIKILYLKVKCIIKTVLMPVGTVFEINYTTADRKRVNRFEYVVYIWRLLNVFEKKYWWR